VKVFLIAITVVIATVAVLFFVAIQPQSKTVHVHAAPGNTTVQMFEWMTGGGKSYFLMDGETCTKVDGPWSTSESGIPMSFYKLTCGNISGYVNAKFVR
jgi:hypothetical protein